MSQPVIIIKAIMNPINVCFKFVVQFKQLIIRLVLKNEQKK